MSLRSLLASAETILGHRFVTIASQMVTIYDMTVIVTKQLAVCQVISQLHLLEQVASAEHIGTTAENLLEAMMSHPDCETQVWLFY